MKAIGATLAVLVLATAHLAQAQSGGFVATLGQDTLHVESFTRTGDRLTGTIVTRSPATRIIRYSMTFAPNGEPQRYEVETGQVDGSPLRTNGSAGSLAYLPDSVIRETLQQGAFTTQRMASPVPVYPGPSLPYLGVSFLMYELAFVAARHRSGNTGETEIHLLTMVPGQTAPQRLRAWLVRPDSAELDYFGVARSGYKFNQHGELLRSDWTNTTYRYRITRVPSMDVSAVARAWSEADRRGAGVGVISPRDTTRATVGGHNVAVDYSRPAKRGRKVWGDVVPWDRVWRLGADFATHLTTSADLRVGNVDVPAGTYTLWMLPSEDGAALLIINSQTRIFGTMYSATRDFARVPLRRSSSTSVVERLTIAIEGAAIVIRWDDLAWSAPLISK